jgi:hypothetical protein
VELHTTFGSGRFVSALTILGLIKVPVRQDANLSALTGPEILVIGHYNTGVAYNLGVSRGLGLLGRVALSYQAVGATPPGRVASRGVSLPVRLLALSPRSWCIDVYREGRDSKDSLNLCLVECNPVLDTIAESLVAAPSIPLKVLLRLIVRRVHQLLNCVFYSVSLAVS